MKYIKIQICSANSFQFDNSLQFVASTHFEALMKFDASIKFDASAMQRPAEDLWHDLN